MHALSFSRAENFACPLKVAALRRHTMQHLGHHEVACGPFSFCIVAFFEKHVLPTKYDLVEH